MDTAYLDVSVKFLPTALQEIDSTHDVGPYDSDGDSKPPPSSAYEVNGLLNVHISSQKRQDKSS
jgi:hypothetical protein